MPDSLDAVCTRQKYSQEEENNDVQEEAIVMQFGLFLAAGAVQGLRH